MIPSVMYAIKEIATKLEKKFEALDGNELVALIVFSCITRVLTESQIQDTNIRVMHMGNGHNVYSMRTHDV